MDSLPEDPAADARELMDAVRSDDAPRVRRLFQDRPALRGRVNDPIGPFDSPPLTSARSREVMDALLDAGADLDAKSRWWAGGFGFLHIAPPELAAYALERGATVDIHAAARLGLLDRLRTLVEGDPTLVHARGGDGQTPLHFARTVEVAALLLDQGADLDAIDVDHESTPAQYMTDHRHEVARYLVERGAKTDILMAAALGDVDRVRAFLDADPGSWRTRGNARFFPMTDRRSGGTIYQWTLGPDASAYQAAARFGRTEVLRLLMDRGPAGPTLIAACRLHDDETVAALIASDPGLAGRLSDDDRSEIANAARDDDDEAVSLMLRVGLPADARGQHGGTPLHWAAYHGNLEMTRALLAHDPPLEDVENDFKSRPIGWATHGSEDGWHKATGDYPGVVDALLAAGARPFDEPRGTEAVKAVQRRYGAKGPSS